jgi:protein phosphatase
LLTITTTYQPATDLGYLLHKNPKRVQSFSLSFGHAYIYYPEATMERCTAALLLDVDPVQLVRGPRGAATLEQYVNDRPDVASSFLSVAISQVFGTALNGHSAARLEHPAEAFAYYRHEGVPKVVCEEKHMGSRAVVIVCRDEEAARKHFGVTGEGIGICYTRTGRRFFDDAALETEMLLRVRTALDTVNFWEKFSTDWACLDCELMPWSVKAQALLLQQYAAVGSAARGATGEAVASLEQAAEQGRNVEELLLAYRNKQKLVTQYVNAYRQYCWPVHAVTDLKLAPFHLLATQGEVYTNKDHSWHMETLAEICRADEALLLATPFKIVDVTDPASVEEGISWWQELTGHGGEGMVVKPLDFVVRGKRGIVQPALKCRGPEYLRIIYGPEYSIPQNMDQLRKRGLGAKRSLALREFALSIESLERFVRGEPLRRVHECVFGVLALESEPVDPRL